MVAGTTDRLLPELTCPQCQTRMAAAAVTEEPDAPPTVRFRCVAAACGRTEFLVQAL